MCFAVLCVWERFSLLFVDFQRVVCRQAGNCISSWEGTIVYFRQHGAAGNGEARNESLFVFFQNVVARVTDVSVNGLGRPVVCQENVIFCREDFHSTVLTEKFMSTLGCTDLPEVWVVGRHVVGSCECGRCALNFRAVVVAVANPLPFGNARVCKHFEPLIAGTDEFAIQGGAWVFENVQIENFELVVCWQVQEAPAPLGPGRLCCKSVCVPGTVLT